MLRVRVDGSGGQLHERGNGAHDVQKKELPPLRDLRQQQLEHLVAKPRARSRRAGSEGEGGGNNQGSKPASTFERRHHSSQVQSGSTAVPTRIVNRASPHPVVLRPCGREALVSWVRPGRERAAPDAKASGVDGKSHPALQRAMHAMHTRRLSQSTQIPLLDSVPCLVPATNHPRGARRRFSRGCSHIPSELNLCMPCPSSH